MIRGWLQPCFFSSGEKRSLPTRSPVSVGIPQVPKLGHSRDFETAPDSAQTDPFSELICFDNEVYHT